MHLPNKCNVGSDSDGCFRLFNNYSKDIHLFNIFVSVTSLLELIHYTDIFKLAGRSNFSTEEMPYKVIYLSANAEICFFLCQVRFWVGCVLQIAEVYHSLIVSRKMQSTMLKNYHSESCQLTLSVTAQQIMSCQKCKKIKYQGLVG